METTELPLVCKQLKNWSGRGQFLLHSVQELEKHLSEITFPVLAEPFVSAIEISVNVFTHGTQTICYLPVYKGSTSTSNGHALHKLRLCPYPWGDELEQRLYKLATSAARAIRSTGWADIDLLLTKEGEIYVMEINARFSGTTRLVSMATGVNPYLISLQAALDEKLPSEIVPAKTLAIEFPFTNSVPKIDSESLFVYYSTTPGKTLGRVTATIEENNISSELLDVMHRGGAQPFLEELRHLLS